MVNSPQQAEPFLRLNCKLSSPGVIEVQGGELNVKGNISVDSGMLTLAEATLN